MAAETQWLNSDYSKSGLFRIIAKLMGPLGSHYLHVVTIAYQCASIILSSFFSSVDRNMVSYERLMVGVNFSFQI